MEVAQERTSGIFIPDSVQKRSNEGIVRRIGPGKRTEYGTTLPVEDLAVGDRVLFLRWNGFEVMVDGETLVSVDEDAIVAVAEGDAVVRLGRDGVVDK